MARALDFGTVKCENHGLASYIPGAVFCVYFTLGVQIDLILVLRSQFFEYLREPLYQQALEHLEAARPEKKLVLFFFQREVADYFWRLARPVIVRDTFAALAPVLGP